MLNLLLGNIARMVPNDVRILSGRVALIYRI
jgi:hypothetical protein